ncbi:MAG: hypothetical protein IJ383_03200 [Bacteroidales bacterium]|nr:hypothetical protein [Bacteroidales bacterium]
MNGEFGVSLQNDDADADAPPAPTHWHRNMPLQGILEGIGCATPEESWRVAHGMPQGRSCMASLVRHRLGVKYLK